MKLNVQELLLKVKNEMASGLPFMQEKTKADITLETVFTINRYGFLEGEDGEFIVFTDKNNEENFYFGGSVLTEKFKKLEKVLSEEEINAVLEVGIQVTFTEKMSINKRKNVDVDFK